MRKVKINKDNCINCKSCIKVCPAKVFVSSDNETIVNHHNLKYCIDCGDCKAVCPEEAVINSNFDTRELDNDELNCDSKQFLSFLEKRRSIRSYRADRLSKEEKQYLNKVASLVPKGGHTESVRNIEIIIIENEELRDTYEVIKDYDVPLVVGNIGAPQLIKQGEEEPLTIDQAKEAVDMIGGDYLGIHFNYLQEVCQPEGDLRARNVLDAVEKISSELPVIAKETGGGVSSDIAVKLEKTGVKAIDVGGMGGTSFAAVEHYRADDETIKELSENLWDWGIPTPISIVECNRSVSLPLIGTGGIKNGIDAAKALSLGADIVGMAGGILPSLMEGKESTIEYLEKFIYHLKAGLFLQGCKYPEELKKQKIILTGELRDWIDI